MHSITVWGGVSLTETPWTETLLDRDPPGQRPPWTETSLDRDPPDRDPQTETPSRTETETPPL